MAKRGRPRKRPGDAKAPYLKYTDPYLAVMPDFELRDTYDDAVRKVYRRLGDWGQVAHAVELYLPPNPLPRKHAEYITRMCLDRRLTLAYACALVDAMQGEVSLFDFFPYLRKYADPKPPPET